MKILQIYNIAPHYRSAIFQMIDRELGCDLVVGDKVADIKKMDYSLLTHKVTEVHNVPFIKYFYFQKGVPSLIRADYDAYIVTGDTHCISNWFLLFLSCLYPKKKVFLWSHGMLGKEIWLKRIIIRLFYALADGAFIYNERSRKMMIDLGIPPKKLTTVYNSLDYDVQLPIRNSLTTCDIYKRHFCNDNKTLVFIGRLTAVKRLDMIIDAMHVLAQRGEYYNFVFVGDGIMRKELEEQVRVLNLHKQVWFYGACYDEKTNAELIYNADLCVSPGNIGLTAIHVMMFGCPAITNDDFNHQMPEFEAIKDGQTGGFFKEGDVESLADAISIWFEQHDNERDGVRRACYHMIDSKWNPHNQIKILKSVLYANVASNKHQCQ